MHVESDRQFCEEMLPKVSRTFAACINLLPKTLAYEVLIAYLLCRIADTIEDHLSLSGPRKRELLQLFEAGLGANAPACCPSTIFSRHSKTARWTTATSPWNASGF